MQTVKIGCNFAQGCGQVMWQVEQRVAHRLALGGGNFHGLQTGGLRSRRSASCRRLCSTRHVPGRRRAGPPCVGGRFFSLPVAGHWPPCAGSTCRGAPPRAFPATGGRAPVSRRLPRHYRRIFRKARPPRQAGPGAAPGYRCARRIWKNRPDRCEINGLFYKAKQNRNGLFYWLCFQME